MTSFHEETSNHCCCQISLPFSCVWGFFLLLVWLNSSCWIRLKKEVSKGWVFKPRLGWCQAHETEYQHCSSLLRAALAGQRARMGWSCCVHKSLRVPRLNPPEIQCSESHRDWEPGAFSLPPKPKQQQQKNQTQMNAVFTCVTQPWLWHTSEIHNKYFPHGFRMPLQLQFINFNLLILQSA